MALSGDAFANEVEVLSHTVCAWFREPTGLGGLFYRDDARQQTSVLNVLRSPGL